MHTQFGWDQICNRYRMIRMYQLRQTDSLSFLGPLKNYASLNRFATSEDLRRIYPNPEQNGNCQKWFKSGVIMQDIH